MNTGNRAVIKAILISIFVLIPAIVNAQSNAQHHVERMLFEKELVFNDHNWIIDYWEQWTTEQRESYLAGVRDTAEAIAFHMARGVGPKELLHSIVKLFIEPKNEIYIFMYSRYEPSGSGRLAHWLSHEVVGVMKNKDYVYAAMYLRNDDIASD